MGAFYLRSRRSYSFTDPNNRYGVPARVSTKGQSVSRQYNISTGRLVLIFDNDRCNTYMYWPNGTYSFGDLARRLHANIETTDTGQMESHIVLRSLVGTIGVYAMMKSDGQTVDFISVRKE